MAVDQVWKDQVEEWLREREIDKMLDVGHDQDHYAHDWKDLIEPDEAIERIVNLFYKIMQLGPPAE